MDVKVLISKIEKLQESILNQSKISQLDLDLQLEYIRKLYDAYLELKYQDVPHRVTEVVKEEKNEPALFDCASLSLFDDLKQEETEKVLAKTEPIEEELPTVEMEIEESEIEEEETEVEEEESEIEEETEVGIEIEEEETEIEIEEEETETETGIEDEKEIKFDINLDDIEFDEDNSDEEIALTKNHNLSLTTLAGIPHSRYYGDEIEIENPIPVQPTTIGERFKSERPSLNEIVSSYKPDESIGTKLQQNNISDLMKSMDMNHKFMFVRELFKGNGSAFTEEINKLNDFNKLNDAIPYLEAIKTKYKWNSQSEAYTELYRLVLRKFAK